MFGALGNIATLMKRAQEMSGKMEAINEDLKKCRATGSAGGGLVEVEVSGLQEVLACRIDEKLFAQGDRELVEDLVRGAVNDAMTKAKALHAESLKSLTGDLNVPGLDDAMAKFMGK